MLDETFSFDEHVKQVCKSSFFHFRNVSRIRKYLTKDSVEIIIHAFITAKLDYCNSLLYGLPKRLISMLQSVQNSVARVVTMSRNYDHITPVLIQLRERSFSVCAPKLWNGLPFDLRKSSTVSGFFQGFFRTVKRPQKLNLELSFETQSSHQKIQCSKNEVV